MSNLHTADEDLHLYIKDEDAESDLGIGTIWVEFTGDWATRQCERYGDRWVCSLGESLPGIGGVICDKRRSMMDDDPSREITREEFERAWEEAIKHYRDWSEEDQETVRFFKMKLDDNAEKGVAYFEFKGQWVTRQCAWSDRYWFCSKYDRTNDGSPILAQETLHAFFQQKYLEEKDEISKEEFENAWKQALCFHADHNT